METTARARDLLSLIDLTSLNDTDNPVSIANLCRQAMLPVGHVAAVCVSPAFVKQARERLVDGPVKVATVVNFPRGTDSLSKVVDVMHQAISDGADEIDIVFPYQTYLAGDKQCSFDFIHQSKVVLQPNILFKVILETGVLADRDMIAEVSEQLCYAGADFLKTSTGKVVVGATVEATRVMLATIKRVASQIKHPVGLKVAGGIRTVEQAVQYTALASSIMGPEWITPNHFRIGASQLVEALAKLA